MLRTFSGVWALAVVALPLVGCADPGEGPVADSGTPTAFDSVFAIQSGVTLEENPGVLNVGIRVEQDPRGGYLVADGRESQVRRYAEDGTLLWHFGRQGLGPGEFQAPVGAARLLSGDIVVADRTGRLTLVDSEGQGALSTMPTGIRPMDGIWVLGPNELLLSGFDPSGPMGPRLHIWSLDAEAVRKSFFSPLEITPSRELSIVVGWSWVTFLADTIVTSFTTMDTLFYFSREGDLHRKVALPSAHLRAVEHSGVPEAPRDPRGRAEFLARFDYVGSVWGTTDGDLYVEYRSLQPDDAAMEWRRWNLLGMSREGQRMFEVRDAPRLFFVDAAGSRFVFQNPETDLPSDWLVATRR
jgi:hypothetical protein